MQGALSQALALESQGRADEAERLYRDILHADRKNGTAIYRRAVLASQRSAHDEAVRLVQSALKHVPDNIRARVDNDFGLIMRRHGDFALEQGHVKDAAASYAEATRFNPVDAQAHFAEAVCRLILGDFAKGWPKYTWRWKAYGDAPEG